MAFSIVRTCGKTSCHLDNNIFLAGKTPRWSRRRQTLAMPSQFGRALSEVKPNFAYSSGNIGYQRNIGALKGVSIQPADNILHNQPTQPFPWCAGSTATSTMSKLIGAVADDATHAAASPAREYGRHNSSWQPAMRLPAGAATCRDPSQVAKPFGRRDGLDNGVIQKSWRYPVLVSCGLMMPVGSNLAPVRS